MKAEPDKNHTHSVEVVSNRGHDTRYATDREVEQIINNAPRDEHGVVNFSNVEKIDRVDVTNKPATD